MKMILVALSFLITLPAYALSPIQNIESNDCLNAWLIEDHRNPIVAIRFDFHGGAALDPIGKEGLARLASATMDEGAGPWTSHDFQSQLQDNSISLSFDADMDGYGGQVLTLKKNLPKAIDLLSAALTQPRFDQEAVERIRTQLVSSLKQREEDPNSIAMLNLYKSILGDHPYARGTQGTVDGMQNITIADLKKFANDRLAKDNLVVGIVGDVTPAETKDLLENIFGGLPQKSTLWKLDEAVLKLGHPLQITQKNVPQSSLVFMQEGIDRHDKDFYAAYILNYILGSGGFSSRLYEEVREKRGLVYSIYSSFINYDAANLWVVGAGTQNALASETLKVVKDEWQKIHDHGVTAEEVENAKTYLTGSYNLRFNSSDTIANILSNIQLQNLPISFLEERNKLVEAVSLEDVNRLAKQLVDPEALSIAIVGQPEGLPPQ